MIKDINISLLTVAIFFKAATGITNGRIVETDKGFVVYLLKAPISPKTYAAWLCGGTIISHWHVLTSASCVLDVTHAYVISGYKKYVPIEEIERDECTRRKKRKIVRTCHPNAFSIKKYQSKRNNWNWGDAAVAFVDSPFDFMDNTYLKYCSYIPRPIKVNFLSFFEKEGTNVIAYGWGHAKYVRPEGDTRDYNEKYLRYASGRVASVSRCRSFGQPVFYYLSKHFEKWFLCIVDYGNLDEYGNEITRFGNIFNSCPNFVFNPESAKNIYALKASVEKLPNVSSECLKQIARNIEPTINDPNLIKVPGICQNDHGGPLTGWRGGKEILLGVATTFTVTSKLQCRAPYAFTSTHCIGKFIMCALLPHAQESRRKMNIDCDASPEKRGFVVVERNISWTDHPHGPAENEEPRHAGPRLHGYDRL